MSKFGGFSAVELRKPQRSQFDLSHYKRITTRMGRLTPVFITECVPSDSFHGSSEILVRVAPLLAPVYDNMILFVHFFFIPNRLLWEDWEEFITGGRLGPGSSDPAVPPIPPYFDIGQVLTDAPEFFAKSSLADYLGVPDFTDLPGTADDYDGIKIDAMPWMAFQKAYVDYYMDRNYLSEDNWAFPYPSGLLDFGTDVHAENLLITRIRAYEHDYFTSALPFVQRGSEVLMPLAGQGSVTYLDESRLYNSDGTNLTPGNLQTDFSTGNSRIMAQGDAPKKARVENIDEVFLDSSSVSINDFRSAYALQVWLERNAVGGSRYTESTQAHFGVRPQDSRLQRAEYIGGGRIPIKISEIVSTAYSDTGDAIVPLANLAGHGITYGNTNRFNYFCAEHGFIIGIASIMNNPSYYQGLARMFRRRSFLDYPWPTFAKLGEQRVDKAELFADAANLTEDDSGQLPLFGYQSRYADWKYIPSSNHGDFRGDLLFWSLTRKFITSPELGLPFVEFQDDTQDRIFAVNGGKDNFWLYVNNAISVRRPLPYFGAPNTLGFQ